jgi:hypothetical protein
MNEQNPGQRPWTPSMHDPAIPNSTPSRYYDEQNWPYAASQHNQRTIPGRNASRHNARNTYVKPALILTIACLVILAVGGIMVGVLHKSAATPNAIQAVQQPDNASQVASKLKCTGFKDLGPAEAGGVVDSGYCKIGNVKYAIDTFSTQEGRDAWLKVSMPLGVNPKWETATSVTYKSVTK